MKSLITVVFFMLTFSLSADKFCSCYSGGLDKQESTRLADIRSEGLNGDHSQINVLLTIVRKPYATNPKSFGPSIDELLVFTALRALTRLQVTEAIPDIDALIKQTQAKYPDLANFATVQRARLQAQANVMGKTGAAGKTQESIEAFIKALGLTPSGINTGAALYKKQFYADANGRYLPHPVEVYALREIADMIYHGSYQEAAVLPDVSALDFSLDSPAALKMRLSPFLPGERASRLVDKIVTGHASPEVQDYELQLLVDEGTLGSSAIAHAFTSLEQQAESEEKHQQRKSLAALFRELSAIGDKQQEPFIKQYVNDPDSTVQDEAKTALEKIVAGDRSIFPKAVDF